MFKVKDKINQASSVTFSIYAIIAAAGTYFCMYAFRKPITAFTFDNYVLNFNLFSYLINISFKDILIISQIIGYATSKFYGIKYISEVLNNKRASSILGLIFTSWIALLCFAVFEYMSIKIFSILINGLCLGMIWGLVFSYLEGRKLTDLLGAGLSVSFIFASGFMKSFARWVNVYFSTFWTPFIVGLIFLIPLCIFVWMLEKIPPPSLEDEKMRTKRAPMSKKRRVKFIRQYPIIVVLSTLIYMVLSTVRAIRDDYAIDIWTTLGMDTDASIFVKTETMVGLILLFLIGFMFMIKNNKLALLFNYGLVAIGLLFCIISSYCFQLGFLSPTVWIILVGIGLYMAYIPFNCIIFERMLATFQYVGTAGFLMYVADAWGYSTVVASLLIKNLPLFESLNWFIIFINVIYVLCSLAFIFTLIVMYRIYSYKK